MLYKVYACYNTIRAKLFSIFAGSSKWLKQRLDLFAEEQCKSATTASELCSPDFKGVQPESRIQSSNRFQWLHIILH